MNTPRGASRYAVREALPHQGFGPKTQQTSSSYPGRSSSRRSGRTRSTSPPWDTGRRPSTARYWITARVRAVFDDTDVLGEIAGGFAVLRRDFVEKNPEAAKNFVEQSARAADWSREHPEEARAVLARILTERGDNGDLARHWTGWSAKGAQATERGSGFLDRRSPSARAACRRANTGLPIFCSGRTRRPPRRIEGVKMAEVRSLPQRGGGVARSLEIFRINGRRLQRPPELGI